MPYQPRDPMFALEQGIALVPEDRKKRGSTRAFYSRQSDTLEPGRAVTVAFFVNTRKEDQLIETYRLALQIKMVNSEQAVRKLSGGNQQKVILARCMALNTDPDRR